jgi:nucleoside-diphosphate-sugar epimerase
MTKVLITGANSFVGTNFRRFSQYPDIDEVSLLNNRIEDIEFKKYDVVLHLAAIVHQSKKIEEQEYYHINRDLCLKVAKLAKRDGVKQFIFLSTTKVYGDFYAGSDPWNEDSECHPADAYGKSKYEAELALRTLENPGFIVSIIRTPVVYGSGVKANMLRLIYLIEKVPLLPFKNVYNSRSYTYIENLVGYIDRIIELRASGTFLVTDNSSISTSDMVKLMAKYLHKNIVLFKVPGLFVKFAGIFAPGVHKRLFGSFCLNNSKTNERLNYKQLFSTEDGIGRMISSYLENKALNKK